MTAWLRPSLAWLSAACVIVACGSGSSDDSGPPSNGGGGASAGTNAGTGAAAGANASAGNPAGGGSAAGSGGSVDSSSDAGEGGLGGAAGAVEIAPHPVYPLVTAHGGPVISSPELVPIYFGDDPLMAQLEQFNDWIVTSDYWKTIGADYGVSSGTHLAPVQFASTPGDNLSDTQIADWLALRVADGSLPKPTGRTVFALFFPADTTITTDGGTATSCYGFVGLHQASSMANSVYLGIVPFAIIPRCSYEPGDELIVATNVASHEYLEAATNPFPTDQAWFLDAQPGTPLEAWQMLTGVEVADLCENQSYDVIDGFTVQDAWSNSAAQAGQNPCQPSDPQHPFFTVFAHDTIYHASAGTTLTLHAEAWANQAAPSWSLGINWGFVPSSDFDGQATLSRDTVANGDDVAITVTIPANPTLVGGRSVYRFTVDSIDPINPNFSHPWPFLIEVP